MLQLKEYEVLSSEIKSSTNINRTTEEKKDEKHQKSTVSKNRSTSCIRVHILLFSQEYQQIFFSEETVAFVQLCQCRLLSD